MDNKTTTKLLSRAEAAERLGVSIACLERWAHVGRPKLEYVRVGRLAKYTPESISRFLTERSATSAAEHAAIASG
jgi:predicted site-specific integrase-resolvase